MPPVPVYQPKVAVVPNESPFAVKFTVVFAHTLLTLALAEVNVEFVQAGGVSHVKASNAK